MIETTVEYYDFSAEDIINILSYGNKTPVKINGENKTPRFLKLYQPFKIHSGERISCAITQHLCVRLGDLAICPCHRLAYDHLLYGKYKVENERIVGVEANNITFYINNMITGYAGFLKCDACPINRFCLKGCRGAQYEVFKDVNAPIPSVCNLMKVKAMYNFINIIYLAKKYDLTEKFQMHINFISDILEQLKEEDKEFYEQWMKIICH